jgi:hypothetical protein
MSLGLNHQPWEDSYISIAVTAVRSLDTKNLGHLTASTVGLAKSCMVQSGAPDGPWRWNVYA